MRPADPIAWLIAGDFNELLFHSKKAGGQQRSERLMQSFCYSLDHNHLKDLGYVGDKFTWSNKHEDESFTKERLDKGVSIQQWIKLYNDTRVESLVARSSDHKPILLSCRNRDHHRIRKMKPFHYEASWNLEKDRMW